MSSTNELASLVSRITRATRSAWKPRAGVVMAANDNGVLRIRQRVSHKSATVRAMPTLTTEKLSPTVGAEITGVDVERLLTDDDVPAAVLAALEEHGALVFRELHIDDASQVAFSKR